MAGQHSSWDFINKSPTLDFNDYLKFDADGSWENLQQLPTQLDTDFSAATMANTSGFTTELQNTGALGPYFPDQQVANVNPQHVQLHAPQAQNTLNINNTQLQSGARRPINDALREPGMPIEGKVTMGGTPQFIEAFKSLALRNYIGSGTEQYLRMLQNRMMARTIGPHGKLPAKLYHPIFLFDVLQLPGSLATVLNKVDTVYLVDRTTPGILPGFQIRKHAGNQQPVLIYTGIITDVVHGAIIFGQGKNQENMLAQHYGTAGNLKFRAWSVFESINTGPTDVHQSQGHAYLTRQSIKVSSFGYYGQAAVGKAEELVNWDFDECLQGKYGPSPLDFAGVNPPTQHNAHISNGFSIFA